MSTKRLLTYEGLEEYNIKWHERLQALAVGDVEDIFTNEMLRGYTWTYEFDTKLTGNPWPHEEGASEYSAWWMTSGGRIRYNEAAIPFWFPSGVSITVDWGDGTIETVNGSGSIDNFNGAEASMGVYHTYRRELQTYNISVTSNQWDQVWLCGGDAGNVVYYISSYGTHWFLHSTSYAKNVYTGEYIYEGCSGSSFFVDTNNAYMWAYGYDADGLCRDGVLSQLAAMRMGCTKIFNPLPKLAGVIQCDRIEIGNDVSSTYNGQTPEQFFAGLPDANTVLPNSMYFALAHYISLTEAPSNLFQYNLNALDFTGCLHGVASSLQSTISYPSERAQSLTVINNAIT